MADKILVEWIGMQKEQGYTSQELQEILIQHGYSFLEIQEALQEAKQPRGVQSTITSSSSKKILIASVISASVLFVGILFLIFLMQIKGPSEQPLQTSPSQNKEQEIIIDTTSNCNLFPEKLATCEPYECRFIHPITQKLVVRKILSKEEKCRYDEEIADNIRMECSLSENLRKEAAEFYSKWPNTETEETTPIQEAIINGECILHQE